MPIVIRAYLLIHRGCRQLMKLLKQDLIANAKLPTSIDVISNLQQSISEGVASANSLASQLETDAGLTARILKLANSAYYGRGSIETVNQAIVLIGENDLISLVLTTEVMDALRFKNSEFNLQQFWKDNIYAALSAKILARHLQRQSAQLFTAALLRKIGWVVLWRANPAVAAKLSDLIKDSSQPEFAVENDFLGFDHANLAAELLTNWKLPSTITEPVRFYLNPTAATEANKQDACILHLADLQMQAILKAAAPDIDQIQWAEDIVGLPLEDLLAETCEEIYRHYDQMTQLLLNYESPQSGQVQSAI